MNYTSSKDLCVSGFIDSPNSNASTYFCLTSDSVHEPDNIFTFLILPDLRFLNQNHYIKELYYIY